MKLRNFIKIALGIFLIVCVAIGLVSRKHPIIMKWALSSAKLIGKPVEATVYANGQVKPDIRVFHIKRSWNGKPNHTYLLDLSKYDSVMLRFVLIHVTDNWVGRPASTGHNAYDYVAGYLFQSEVGAIATPFQDDMKGYNFDPQLAVIGKQIKFLFPPHRFTFDSIRIDLK